MESTGSCIRRRRGQDRQLGAARRGPGPTAQAAHGCPWVRSAGQGPGSEGAFGLAVDAGKKKQWNRVGVERDK
jgi:hypothetical protein